MTRSATNTAAPSDERHTKKDADALGSRAVRSRGDVVFGGGGNGERRRATCWWLPARRFRDIMGDAWTTPTVSFDREDEEGSCVRFVYRV